LYLRGPTSKGREGKGRGGKRRKGRRGEGKRRERDSSPPPMRNHAYATVT